MALHIGVNGSCKGFLILEIVGLFQILDDIVADAENVLGFQLADIRDGRQNRQLCGFRRNIADLVLCRKGDLIGAWLADAEIRGLLNLDLDLAFIADILAYGDGIIGR